MNFIDPTLQVDQCVSFQLYKLCVNKINDFKVLVRKGLKDNYNIVPDCCGLFCVILVAFAITNKQKSPVS